MEAGALIEKLACGIYEEQYRERSEWKRNAENADEWHCVIPELGTEMCLARGKDGYGSKSRKSEGQVWCRCNGCTLPIHPEN
jgi:hypothetical protein